MRLIDAHMHWGTALKPFNRESVGFNCGMDPMADACLRRPGRSLPEIADRDYADLQPLYSVVQVTNFNGAASVFLQPDGEQIDDRLAIAVKRL